MRGAGTADHTGDNTKHGTAMDPAVQREELRRTMSTCAVSGQPLRFGKESIVTCPYGRLYHKEAAVEALLQRKQTDETVDALGEHIRGLKDLKEVRFHLSTKEDGGGEVNDLASAVVPICPIRGTELNGQIPAIALIPGGTTVNVVSERAWKEMGSDILDEYGPSKKTIRLAPTALQLQEMKEELEARRNNSSSSTDHKKSKGEKRKRKEEQEKSSTRTATNKMGDEIRAKAASKVEKSEALSSLFVASK